MFTKLLLWLSGADPQLLARCSRLPLSERKRLAALGGMVLIPGALALCSWGYAAWIFIHDLRVVFGFGLAGAGIVMWIDRSLLMATHKTNLESRAAFWGGLATRIVLSITLNYFLADPLMLLVFQGPIAQQMGDDIRAREVATFNQASALRADAYAGLATARTDATRDLSTQLDEKTIQWECMNSLVTLEMAGGVAAGTPVKDKSGKVCGYASGRAGCKEQCRNDIAAKDQLATDMHHLQGLMQARLNGIDSGSVSAAIQEGQRVQERVLAETPPTDYATRRRALGEAEAANPIIWWTHWYLVVMLIAIDSIALIIKAIQPSGEYEEQRDSALAIARATVRAERDGVVEWVTKHGQALQQEELTQEANKQQIVAFSRRAREILTELSQEFQAFQTQLQQLERMIAQIRSEEDRERCMERAADLRNAFNDALLAAVKRFRTETGM
jgi:hypothetical protein